MAVFTSHLLTTAVTEAGSCTAVYSFYVRLNRYLGFKYIF